MPLGFSFRQTLTGSYWLLDAPIDECVMVVRIKAETPDARAFIRQRTWRVSGQIDADRLASAQALEGILGFKLIEDRRITCRFTFCGDDGRRYELTGMEEWSKLAPIESLTVLPASVYDDRGDEIARASLRFDLRSEWASWLRSFRLEWEW